MNKKFIIVSLSIFVISLAFILGFKIILGDKVLYINSFNYDQELPIIKYVGFEEDENVYKIKVSVKNNSDYYASFNGLSLRFTGVSQGEPIFNGYNNDERKSILNHKEGEEYNYSSFFDPYEEREYVFEVSKGLSFNKEMFHFNEIDISYSYQFYKYKINNNTVIGNAFGGGGSKRILTELD